MRRLIFALTCLLSIGRLTAQNLTVEQKGIPFGGNILDIEQGAGGVLFAAVESAGLYKSQDNGVSWTRITGVETSVIDLDIDANGIIYAVAAFNLYISTDNTGSAYTLRNLSGPFQNRPAITVKKFGTAATSPLYVLTSFQGVNQVVFRSVDNGVNWTAVFTEADYDYPVLGILVNNLGNVFLYQREKGIRKSGTGASTYALSNAGISNPLSTVYAWADFTTNVMAYSGSDLLAIFSGVIYKSTDNGANWTAANPPGYTNFYNASITSFGGTGAYVANEASDALHIYSAGSWLPSVPATFKTQTIKKLLAKASNDLYLACDLGVMKSPTGALWTSASQGIDGVNYSFYAAQALFTFGDVLYTMSDPMFKSTDNGATWASHAPIESYNNAVVVSPDGSFISSDGDYVWVSTDAGTSWVHKPIVVGTAEVLISDDTYVYGLAHNKLVKTANNGDSWTNIPLTGFPASGYLGLPQNLFIKDGHLFFAYGNGNLIKYYRTNLSTGVTTEVPAPSGPINDAFLSNGLWGYGNKLVMYTRTTSTTQIYTSTDLGASWTNVSTPVLSNAAFFVTNYNYWVLVGNGSLKLSRDEGQTWMTAAHANLTTNAKAAIIDPLGRLSILLNNKGLFTTTKPIAIPASPTNLRITGSTFNEVRLEWDNNSDNETYFKIERSTANNNSYDSIGYAEIINQAAKAGAYLDVTPDPERTYYYRVIAGNAAGRSVAFTNEISITTPAKCPQSIPDQRNWLITTLNQSTLGVKTGNGPLSLTRFDDSGYIGAAPLGGTGWTGSYELFNTGFSQATVVENCGIVYLKLPTDAFAAPNGNGTWDAVTKKITIKWKLNEAVTGPAAAAPVAETSEMVISSTYPAPGAPPFNFIGVYDDTGIGISWGFVPAYGTEFGVERATASGGPFAEVGRVIPSAFFYVDRSNLVNGTTYFYRFKTYNPSNPAGVVGAVSAGVLFTKPYFAGVETQTGFPVATKTGTVWTDVNNDGFDDLFYVNGVSATRGEPPTVMINQQNGTFVKKIFLNELDLELQESKFADFNNDGNADALVYNTDVTINRHEIYSGDGAGNFTKVWTGPQKAIIYTLLEDFDKDGSLDLLIGTSSNDALTGFPITTLSIMRNTGNFNFVKTTDVLSAEPMSVAGYAIADYDNDGDRDIYIPCNGNFAPGGNFRMLANNGDGTYTKKDIPSLVAGSPTDNMGFAEWVDVDNDLDFDLVTMLSDVGRDLFRNNGNGTFTNGGTFSTLPGSISSAVWMDVDNDGDQDMVANAFGDPSPILLNNGGTTFTQKGGESVTVWNFGRNVYVASDYNHDGSLDLSVGSNDIKGRIFKGNNFAPSNKWINIRLSGRKSNRSAIGSVIKVTAGASSQMKQVTTAFGTSSGGHSSLQKHFGVGTATKVDIEVTWPNGKKQKFPNIDVNQFIEIVEDTDGPLIASSTPAKNAVDVHATTLISFTMDESFTVATDKFIDIVNVTAPGTPLFHINANTGVKSDKTMTYTLAGKLPPNVNISVIIQEGTFADGFGNANAAVALNDWKFKTNAGPLVTALKPAHAATGIATNTSMEITFDKNIVAVGGKFLRIKDGAADLGVVDVANGTIAANKFATSLSFILPANKLLEVVVDAGAFIDNNTDKNDFAGISGGAWTFTTGAPLDVTKPTVTFTASLYQELDKGFSIISANAVAEDAGGVESVIMYSRKTSESAFTPTPGSKGSGNNWIIPISNTLQDDMGFEYYIEAKDLAQNKGRSPLNETEFHRSKTKIPSTQTSITVNSGGTKQSWRIISIPYDFPSDDRQISSLFGALGDAGRDNWRLLHYTNTPVEAWLEYPGFTVVERGKGYFINSVDGGQVSLANATSPSFGRGNLFSRDLVKGWNQIGNPYSVAINWDNIKAYNNNGDIGGLVLFSNGSYSSGNVIQPMQGGFVFMNNPANVKFSFPGQTVAGGRTSGTQNGPIDSKNWIVDFKLTAGDLTSDLGGFGMNEEADDSYDQHDRINAPRFFDFLELSFQHPEHFMRKFARDVIPTADEYVWEFNVQSSREETTVLSWDNDKFGEGTKDLYLYDVDAQIPVNMRNQTGYSFDTRAGRRFRIYFGEDIISKIKPERALLGAAFPNPMTGFATIPFSLPENNGTLPVRLEVFDMLGRKVATLLQGDMKPGFYKADWLPAEAANSNGFYIYRLTVGNGVAGEVLSGKIMLKR